MIVKASSFLFAFLCTLLVFAALVDAAGPPPPSRPNPSRPKPPRPPIPHPNENPGSLPKIPEIGPPEGLSEEGYKEFSIGTYANNKNLYRNFAGPNQPYFEMMYDFFAAIPEYPVDPEIYRDLKGSEQPFRDGKSPPQGKPLQVRLPKDSPNYNPDNSFKFDPMNHEDVCRLLGSLANYCENQKVNCACYSSVYYVPDQWNSLASGCAGALSMSECVREDNTLPLCQAASTARSHTNYCSSSLSAVKFANKAGEQTPQPAPDATTTPDAATTLDATTTPDAPPDGPQATQTSDEGNTPTSVETTPESTTLQSTTLQSTTPGFTIPESTSSLSFSASTSWSSRSLDSSTSKKYSRIFLVGTSIFLLRNYAVFA